MSPEPIDFAVQEENEGNDELPDSSGKAIDRFFWWGWRTFLPQWLQGDEPFAKRVMAHIWIDCPWCLFMRGVTIGAVLGGACTVLVGLLVVGALTFW